MTNIASAVAPGSLNQSDWAAYRLFAVLVDIAATGVAADRCPDAADDGRGLVNSPPASALQPVATDDGAPSRGRT